MKVETNYSYKKLTPSYANNWLTDGDTFSREVYLPIADDESRWREVSVNEQENAEDSYPDMAELEAAKARKRRAIEAYDASDAVNSFVYNGVAMWIPKELRISLTNSSSIEKASGKTDTMLWYDGVRFELAIDTLQQMLSAIEIYALACYNTTEMHKAAVKTLERVEEVEGYDYTVGYPERLVLG